MEIACCFNFERFAVKACAKCYLAGQCLALIGFLANDFAVLSIDPYRNAALVAKPVSVCRKILGGEPCQSRYDS